MGHQTSQASLFTVDTSPAFLFALDTSHRPIIPRHRLRSSRVSASGHSDNTAEASGSVPSSSRIAIHAPQPRRQIPEEDECPVCHLELPSRTLPDFEAQREAHITSCIASHSAFSSTPSGAGAGTSPATPSSAARRWRTGMFPYKATEKDCADDAECTIAWRSSRWAWIWRDWSVFAGFIGGASMRGLRGTLASVQSISTANMAHRRWKIYTQGRH